MADEREPTRLHPDDVKAIALAMQKGPIRFVPDASDVPSGIDARVISEAVRAIVGEKVSAFLTRDQIRELVRDVNGSQEWADKVKAVIDGRLKDIGLQMDDAHIEETVEFIRSAKRFSKRITLVLSGIATSIAIAVVYALAHLIGLNLPALPSKGVE